MTLTKMTSKIDLLRHSLKNFLFSRKIIAKILAEPIIFITFAQILEPTTNEYTKIHTFPTVYAARHRADGRSGPRGQAVLPRRARLHGQLRLNHCPRCQRAALRPDQSAHQRARLHLRLRPPAAHREDRGADQIAPAGDLCVGAERCQAPVHRS